MANMSAALLTHGRIETTLSKAKALRPFVEKVITLARKADGADPARAVHLRRQAIARVRDKAAVATLFRDRVSEFKDRQGGYTRIYKLGQRVGDGAEMALITLINAADEGYGKRRTGKPAQKAETPAAQEAAPAEEPKAQTPAAEETLAEEPKAEAPATEETSAQEAPQEEQSGQKQ